MNYEVLNPRGVRDDMKRYPLSPRLKSLAGKTVYCVTMVKSTFMEELANHLTKFNPGVKTIFKIKPGGFATDAPPELQEEIVKNADALIYGTGIGGGTGMAGTGRVIEMEKQGIPSVYTVGEPFVPDIKVSAEMRGMPDLRIVPIHLVEEVRVKEDITEEQYQAMISKIVDALTMPLTAEEKKAGTIVSKKPPRIAMTGTLTEVQDYYYSQKWTDGLPIIPPTEEKVKEMLKGTSHSPDEVVTTRMWPEELSATVEKVAIVGVMAGCRPEYMPVLLAMVKAWDKGPFNLLVRSGSSSSTMTIVNGPVRREIGMNTDLNAMGPCNQANASLGRFLRMAIINLGGSWPSVNDMSALGSPVKYGFCFPENEEKNPWKPFHVSLGFKPDESVVSIMIGGWHHMSINSYGQSPDFILGSIAKAIVSFQGANGAVVTMAPGMARHCAADGMSKEDVEQYIWDHAVVRVSEIRSSSMTNYAGLPDDTLVHVCQREVLKVVVTGGETSLSVTHVWSESPPSTESVDIWR